MHHKLPRLRPTGGKAHPKYNVVHPELHKSQKVLAGDALHTVRLVIGTPELLLGDTVVPASLLLFQEPDAEFRLPLTAPTVLSWRIGLPLQGILSHIGEHHSCPPITPGFGSRVARHPLPPTPLRRSATVVRLAAYGVLLRLPLKPMVPADSQAITLPSWSVTLTMVLLNELFMCTTAVEMFLRALRRVRLAPRARPCARCRCLPIYFFLPPIAGFGPLRWRALVLVRCPRTGKPRRCRMPR